MIVEFEDSIHDVNLPAGEITRREVNKIWIAFNRQNISAFDLINGLGTDKGIKDIAIQEADIETIVTQIYEHGLDGEPTSGNNV